MDDVNLAPAIPDLVSFWWIPLTLAVCMLLAVAWSFHTKPICRFCGGRHPARPENYLCLGPAGRKNRA